MKQYNFLEVDKNDVQLLKNMCETYYQIAKENWSLKLMLKSKRLEKRLDLLFKT